MGIIDFFKSALAAFVELDNRTEEPVKGEVFFRKVYDSPIFPVDLASPELVSPVLRLEHDGDCRAFLFEGSLFVTMGRQISIYDGSAQLVRQIEAPHDETVLHQAIDADRLLMLAEYQLLLWTISENTWEPISYEMEQLERIGWVGETLVGFTEELDDTIPSHNFCSYEVTWLIDQKTWKPSKAHDPTLGGRLSESTENSCGDITRRYSKISPVRVRPPVGAQKSVDRSWFVFKNGEPSVYGHWVSVPAHSERNPGELVACHHRDGLMYGVFPDALLFWSDLRLRPVRCLGCGKEIQTEFDECPCGAELPSYSGCTSAFSGQLEIQSDIFQRWGQLEDFLVSFEDDQVKVSSDGEQILSARFFSQPLPTQVLISKPHRRLFMIWRESMEQPGRIAEYRLEQQKAEQPPQLYELVRRYWSKDVLRYVTASLDLTSVFLDDTHLVIEEYGVSRYPLRISPRGLVYEP